MTFCDINSWKKNTNTKSEVTKFLKKGVDDKILKKYREVKVGERYELKNVRLLKEKKKPCLQEPIILATLHNWPQQTKDTDSSSQFQMH